MIILDFKPWVYGCFINHDGSASTWLNMPSDYISVITTVDIAIRKMMEG